MKTRPKYAIQESAFTVVEMLITTAILSVMSVLLFAGVRNVREMAKLQYCRNNLREVGAAFDLYDTYWSGKLPPVTGIDDDDLRALYPRCTVSLDIFVCISTGNQANTHEDLADNAVGGRTAGPGTSYEYLSHYLYDSSGSTLTTPRKKTRSSVDIRGDKIWLIMDAMEAGIPNIPDMADNHYETGGNVLFADSHVEWVERGKWREAFRSGNSR
ncbi:MAG: type II secretion system protein [Planctomycetota bacterium]|jgi:prepilin-type processing-associated H-X9-DG protein|nr:type II secretion system protein [Planctomycetota bacterium]